MHFPMIRKFCNAFRSVLSLRDAQTQRDRTCWFLPLIKSAGMPALRQTDRPTDRPKVGKNNSIAAPAAAAAHDRFTTTPRHAACSSSFCPLGAGAGGGTAHKLHSTLLLLLLIFSSFTGEDGTTERSIVDRTRGSFCNLATIDDGLIFYPSLGRRSRDSRVASPTATRARMLLLCSEIPRQTATTTAAPAPAQRSVRAQVGGGGGGGVVGKRLFPGDLPTCAKEYFDRG